MAFYDGLAAGKPLVLLDHGPLADLVIGRGAGIALPQDVAVAARELRDYVNDGDGLRRAAAQAAALGAGRFARDRSIGELRTAIETRVAAEPRAVVMRRRVLATKRTIDVVLSATALVVLSPIMFIIAIAIAAKMGWPPLFGQERPGLNGQIFRIHKFRSMTNARDAEGAALPDEQRLTGLGKFLRRTSLDELPELFNVLKGDMSLVGPRPLLPEYLAHYTAEQRRRHEVRPGMTGWSQINGRNALTWEEKFALDVWYVDNLSLWLDVKILFKTAWIALLGRGVNAPGHATMPRFDEIMARREGAEDI
jgi:lipopolysaccharide/colanic/teichoic acid biosynthesis glycosyltransferase